jgi:catechol 2,3-dioxygenase-like lactoylglutathione lyase family enzyme
MNSTQVHDETTSGAPSARGGDTKLEVVVIPASDPDRAADFYHRLRWRLDADLLIGSARVLQFTPPGSQCSIIFGADVTSSAPGTAQFLILVVSDIEAARRDLVSKGVDASGIFHDAGGGYNFFDPDARASGPDPARRSYASYLTFQDPDGNKWLVQEITTRFAGRIEPNRTTFDSARDLAGAMRRAAAAHGNYEKRIAATDPNWPDWYAAYIAAEQAGTELPG